MNRVQVMKEKELRDARRIASRQLRDADKIRDSHKVLPALGGGR